MAQARLDKRSYATNFVHSRDISAERSLSWLSETEAVTDTRQVHPRNFSSSPKILPQPDSLGFAHSGRTPV